MLAGSDDNAKPPRPTPWTKPRIHRREALFELTMAHGRADLIVETPITLVGWKPQIDGTDWMITDIEDILDDKGYITRMRCEVKVGA